jgi:hypothetical protein
MKESRVWEKSACSKARHVKKPAPIAGFSLQSGKRTD